jgi:RNA 3'-terminal phosphate cyclase
MTDECFTAEDLASAESYPTLGPAYFAADRAAKRFMAAWTEEHLAPMAEAIVKEVASKIADKVRDDFKDFLLGDTESNLRTAIRRMVDGTVNALLGGEAWALWAYPLASGYEAASIRAKIAEHIGDEVARRRISELEAEVARLQERLSRDRY